MSHDSDAEGPDPYRPDRAVPPQTDELAAELAAGDRQLCHCLDCGRQLVTIRHGDACLFCGSAAIVVE